MSPELQARLEKLQIIVVAEGAEYSMFARDGCLGVAGWRSGRASIGSTGLALEQGLAYLMWRGDNPVLVGRGFEMAASTEQVERIRRFSADLQSVLEG